MAPKAKSNKKHISVVIPVYKTAGFTNELYKRLNKTLSKITPNFEIIFVNDYSPDNAWELISKLAKKDKNVKGINFSKNFGQHHAITAGIDCCDSDWVVVMDGDLQDIPEEIEKLYKKANEGFDYVLARRVDRKDTYFKILTSKIFYKILRYFSSIDGDSTVASFGIYSGKIINTIKEFRENFRSFGMMIQLAGFEKAYVDVEHAEREDGKSSYNFSKRLNLAIDTIVAHSNKPLKLSIKFGLIISILSLMYGFWLVLRYAFYGVAVEGWTSVMVSIYVLSGLLFINMGFLGLYVGKIFNEAKNRPLYIIKEKTF